MRKSEDNPIAGQERRPEEFFTFADHHARSEIVPIDASQGCALGPVSTVGLKVPSNKSSNQRVVNWRIAGTSSTSRIQRAGAAEADADFGEDF